MAKAGRSRPSLKRISVSIPESVSSVEPLGWGSGRTLVGMSPPGVSSIGKTLSARSSLGWAFAKISGVGLAPPTGRSRVARRQRANLTYGTGRFTGANPVVVTSRDDLADFVEVVRGDFRLGGGQSEWENASLDRFLESLAGFAEARVVDQADQEVPTWRLFPEMIAAATGYE